MDTDTIHLDERGVAWTGNSNIKVVEVILDHVQGLSPEQTHAEYPHLSVAQIRAAVAYYGEHPQEIDTLMQQWQERYETEYAKPENQAWREQMRLRAGAVSLHSKGAMSLHPKEEVAA